MLNTELERKRNYICW